MVVLLFTGCGGGEGAATGPVTVQYWEKWTSFEGEAMKAVVDRFNAMHDDIFVNLLTISQIDRKILVATAGGDPPDVAGLFSGNVINYAIYNALMPLDHFVREAGIRKADYIDVYWRACVFDGHVYALPTTPAATALHWNKRMFREVGLDPERPPRTIKELDEYSAKLTKRDSEGNLVQMGFLPSEPGWWNFAWGYCFGGRLWDGKQELTPDDAKNVEAYRWVQKYSEEYGVDQVLTFRSGFGNFDSPQNAFLDEKLAMVLQGVWMANFINMHAPHLEWDAAPFPTTDPKLYGISLCQADVLVIPRGARHPREAFEFIRYVNTQEGMELLCRGQWKHTPLMKTSPGFVKNHPNPRIKVFIDMAKGPHAVAALPIGIWNEYSDEMVVAFDQIWTQEKSAAEALAAVKKRMQRRFERERYVGEVRKLRAARQEDGI